ncbi:MAG: nitronate monooxygenase family protein [Bacteroidia bacterium]|jgi:nitronate monooxygenase
MKTNFTDQTGITYPIIMAPMFLVSNEAMMQSAIQTEIMGVFPTLNYRKHAELDELIKRLQQFKSGKKGSFGVNLIVQKTNPMYNGHLKICVENKVPFYITSLGSPREVIEAAHSYGAKVYCDVTNITHAEKCANFGCDGFIAVGQGAGGHAGPYAQTVLIPTLQKHFPSIPVIAAGGIATGDGIAAMMSLGAAGVSIGTRYIASKEAEVSDDYKNCILKSGMDNIVMTERLSGTPCNIINTPYAKKIGYKQNWLEKFLSNNATTKKYFKMLVQYKGIKALEQAIKPGNYKTLWTAGQTVELIDDILTCNEITERLIKETYQSVQNLNLIFKN